MQTSSRIETYSLDVIITISKQTDEKIINTIKQYGSINGAMEWRRSLQASLVRHRKNIPDMNVQMDIVDKILLIERYCRPFIYKKHFINARSKYPMATDQKIKSIANDRTEKTIKKYSY